jgi:hypothetical protein
MDVEIMKEAADIACEKTDLAFTVAVRGRLPMKRAAESMEVSRSRLAERHEAPSPAWIPRHVKDQDEELLHHIRAILDE